MTASFSPANTTGSSVLTLTAGSAAAAGISTVTVTGVSGSLRTTATVSLSVTSAQNFTLSASPASLSIKQGTKGSSTISVGHLGGFSGSVALSASGLPGGVTASFSPASATSSSVLTLTASAAAAAGMTTVFITGVSGNLRSAATIGLTITGTPNFSLSAAPASLSLKSGANGSIGISVNRQNGFTGNVSLAASGLPTGVTASFSPASTTAASTLKLTAGSSPAAGVYAVTITGISGALRSTVTLTLTVTAAAAGNFTLSVSPASLSVARGASGTTIFAAKPQNGFNGTIYVGLSGVPAGVNASFAPTPGQPSLTLTLLPVRAAPIGTYTITITGTSGALSHAVSVSLTVK